MATATRESAVRRGALRILGIAVVAQFGTSVVEQGIPTLTGFLKSDLGLSAATAGLAVSSFTFGRIFGSYAAGAAADRLGERRVLVAGGLVTGALVVLAAFLPLPALIALLVLSGVSSASSTPAGGRMVLTAFPRNRHGLALGIRQTAIPLGGLFAALLLPWVAHVGSWRWSLGVAGVVAALAVVPLLVFGVERVADRPAGRPRGPGPARDRNIRLLTLWGCLIVSGQSAIVAFLALDLHTDAGLALTTASLLVAVAQVAGIIGRVAWGAASDRGLRAGRKPLLYAVTAVGLASALVLLAVPRTAPIAVLAVAAFFGGLALIGWQGLWVTMVTEAAGPDRAGAATGFGITFIALAIALSPPLYGLVADLAGYRAIWGALACVLALAFVPAALVHERDASGNP